LIKIPKAKRMKILYIFPHPDDESFGPAAVIHKQKKTGHEVHLLTLTRGEATKVRYKLGISEGEMAGVREKELLAVGKYLKLDSQEILTYADGSLAHINPLELEQVVRERLVKISPDVVVTYAVHGISGHHDHLTTHFVVKQVFSELKGSGIPPLQRLAMLTLPREEGLNDDTRGGNYKVNRSKGSFIDAVIDLDEDDKKAFLHCLDLYPTFQEVINDSGVKQNVKDKVYFEIFGEDHKPPLKDLFEGLQK
jgi:LmbE family N-acetylglucosaminyl deacetylase